MYRIPVYAQDISKSEKESEYVCNNVEEVMNEINKKGKIFADLNERIGNNSIKGLNNFITNKQVAEMDNHNTLRMNYVFVNHSSTEKIKHASST